MSLVNTAPRTLDHYALLVPLGEGGMGEVWAARDTRAMGTRIVALKTTKQGGQEAAKVLFDEARIASLIEHPNVCKVYELGRALGVQYMVMEFCDGASLFDLLQAQPNKAIAHPIAVKIVAEVAAGLHAAHELVDEAGTLLHVVHRDVSPQNILIASDGSVTISDFGVAKARGQVHQATVTGEVKGKLSYMAPEQVRSKDIDRRADIFALGCVLYMATVGKRPFCGGDAVALMYKILEANVEPPSSIEPSFPRSLEELIMKALERDPASRFQTALEFQLALERWLRDEKRRVSSADIALLLEHSLGERISARNARIRALANGTSLESPDEEQTQREDSSPSSEDVVSTRTILESAFESQVPPFVSTGRTRLFALGALALSIIAAGFSFEPKQASDSPALSEPEAKGALAPPVPDVATISARVHPETAQILLDGEVVGRGSAVIERSRSAQEGVLAFVLAGYQSVERKVRFDRDQGLEIALLPVEGQAKQLTVDSADKSKKKSSRPVLAQAQPKNVLAEKSDTAGSEKKPRALDPVNPFAHGTP